MVFYLYDMSKLSITHESLIPSKQKQTVGVILKTSYFNDEQDLKNKIKQIRKHGVLTFLEIDCLKNTIFGIKPHLAIFKACKMYESNPKEAIDITYERAFKVAQTFLKLGIDLYSSNIFSFSNEIFNSINADLSFRNHHIAIMSSWINGLNSAGMLACVKLNNAIENKEARNALYRLRVQISAALCSENIFNSLKNELHFNGHNLQITNSNENIKNSDHSIMELGGKIRQEQNESVEV